MTLNNIPKRDVAIIQNVADHVARRMNVPGYDDDDLRQELTVIGLSRFVESWDESKQQDKVQAKRDNNLRIYMKQFLMNRANNLIRSVGAKKRGGDIKLTTFDTRDERYQALFRERNDGEVEEDIEVVLTDAGLTKDQMKIIGYILDNDLNRKGSNRKTLADSTGLPKTRVDRLLKEMSENMELRKIITDRA